MVGQLFVVHTHLVQDGGLQIMDVDFIPDAVITEFIGFAIRYTRLNATPGEPHGKGFAVVIAAVERGFFTAPVFAHRGAAELAAPDNEGFVKQAFLAQVSDEGGHGLVDFLAAFEETAFKGFELVAAVRIPPAVEKLDKPDAAFNEAASQKAVVGKGRLARLGAVHLMDRFRFLADVHGFGHRHLHAEGHFVLGDPGEDFRVAHFLVLQLVKGTQRVDGVLSNVTADARRVRDVEDRVALGAQLYALVHRGQETAAPHAFAGTRGRLAGYEDDEAREVLVLRAQAIG